MAMAMSTSTGHVAETCVLLLVFEAAKHAAETAGQGKDPAEAIGCRLGTRLAARAARGRAYAHDALDVVKLLCKEVWPMAFGKSVDNLKTNHRGVFVLHDAKLKWLMRASAREHDPNVQRELASIAALVCGLIRGALGSMGVRCTVQADVSQAPACACSFRCRGAKAKVNDTLTWTTCDVTTRLFRAFAGTFTVRTVRSKEQHEEA